MATRPCCLHAHSANWVSPVCAVPTASLCCGLLPSKDRANGRKIVVAASPSAAIYRGAPADGVFNSARVNRARPAGPRTTPTLSGGECSRKSLGVLRGPAPPLPSISSRRLPHGSLPPMSIAHFESAARFFSQPAPTSLHALTGHGRSDADRLMLMPQT